MLVQNFGGAHTQKF